MSDHPDDLSSARFYVTDGAGPGQTYSAASMFVANADDHELCNQLLDMAPGESITVGGGAAPLVAIVRVA